MLEGPYSDRCGNHSRREKLTSEDAGLRGRRLKGALPMYASSVLCGGGGCGAHDITLAVAAAEEVIVVQ
jgi:hypothetical protein